MSETNEYCHTTVQVNQFEYRWSISNFLFYCVELGQSVESNSFIFGPGEWKLRYNSTLYDQHLQFTLKYLGKLESNNTDDDGTADPAVFIKLALLSRTGSELEYLTQKYTNGFPIKKKNVLTTITFSDAKKKYLEDPSKMRLLKNNGQLSVSCLIKIPSIPENETNSLQDIYHPILSLRDDIGNLLDSKINSDVVLTAANGDGRKNFHAHKCILAARSPVFQAMFKHSMKESATNRVVIDDIDEETLKQFLRYIYQGIVPTTPTSDKSLNQILFLLNQANKYQITGLKLHCENCLYSYVNEENACIILEFADRFSCKDLAEFVAQFISVNSEEIKKSEDAKKYISEKNELLFKALAGLNIYD